MVEQVRVILPRTKKELEEVTKLIEEGKAVWGGERPTQEQLDKYPLSYFDEDEEENK